jgi:hypothetical protein
LTGTGKSGRSSDFQRRLASIREDPKVKRLARKHAGSQDLAEDALNETFCAVASVGNPDSIEDLRPYFCKVLIRTANRLRFQLGATPVDDIGRVAADQQDKPGCGPSPPPSIEDKVSANLLIQAWCGQLANNRGGLVAKVPGRSPDPVRYREAILSIAGRLIAEIAAEDYLDALSGSVLRATYPEWFAQPGTPANTLDQRACRARADVIELLKLIIRRRDLNP